VEKLKKNVIAKGAANIYFETTVGIFSGYILWFLLTKLTTPEVIGTSSTIVSIAAIFTTVVLIGVNQGVQRFSARSFSEHRLGDTQVIVLSSLVLLSMGILFGVIAIIVFKDWIYNVNLDYNLIILSILLVVSSGFATLFRSIMISFLYTKSLPRIMVITSLCKIILAIILVLNGTGPSGIIAAYISTKTMAAVLLAWAVRIFLKEPKRFSNIKLILHSSRRILIASIASWIPALINVIGIQLGTIIVFGFEGASKAGIYIIAFSLFSAIAAIINSVFAIAFPALSAMPDGRKRAVCRLIKISLVISLPLSSSIVFYSDDIIIILFGKDYVDGSLVLKILLLSILPNTVTLGINSLVYSYGKYRYLLAIGLCSTIPRTAFSFILVLIYGSTGVAIAYTLGAIMGFIMSIIIAKKIGMLIVWRDLGLTLIIPMTIAFAIGNFQSSFILGVPATLVLSYGIFLKFHIINRSDIQDFVCFLPNGMTEPIINVIGMIKEKLNRYK